MLLFEQSVSPYLTLYLKLLKRLWEQWTQYNVMGAFRPTFLPIENLQENCMPAVFQEIYSNLNHTLAVM